MSQVTLRGLRSDLMAVIGLPLLGAIGAHALYPPSRLLVELERLGAQLGAPGPTPRRVLFVSLKPSWIGNMAYESVLAFALAQRGAECTFLLQGEALPMCDQRWFRHTVRTRAWAVEAWARAFERHLPFAVHRIERFVSGEERRTFEGEARKWTADGATVEWRDIERLITPSLSRFFRRARLPGDAAGLRIRRRFIEAALMLGAALPRALARLRPDVVVAVNGSFFGERMLIDLCRQSDVSVYSYDPGLMKGTLQFRLNDAHTGDCPAAWQWQQHRRLDAGQEAQIRAIVEDRRRGGEMTQRYHSPADALDRFRRTAGMEGGRPHVALFTNVVWDAAVQFREIAFRDMYEWLDTTIEFFGSHPEAGLTIRVHPGEVRAAAGKTMEPVVDYLRGRFRRLPGNVSLVPPEAQFNSYQLIEHSDAVLSYTSTVGLESALMGKPTIVVARTHYRGKGFTLDPSTREEYFALLARSVAGDPPAPQDLKAAWRYAYAFFVRAQIPFPFLGASEPGRFRGLEVPDLAYLAGGRHRGLDAVCDAVLAGREPFMADAS